MTTEMTIENITPEWAENVLKNNVGNRKVRKTRVEQYARDMSSGSWALTGDAVRFNEAGDLVDGQHRLLAAIKAKASFKSVVITGVDDAAKMMIDSGAKRHFADVLHYHGYKDRNQLAASVKFCWEYENTQFKSPSPPSYSELLNWLQENQGIVDACRQANSVKVGYRQMSTVSAALLYYTGSSLPGEFEFFLKSIASGEDLHKGMPLYALRRHLDQSLRSVRKTPIRTMQALIIKAWNAHISGDDMHVLRYVPTGDKAESFPIIVTTYPGVDVSEDSDDRVLVSNA